MLVKGTAMRRVRDDGGSTLVVVLIVMLVLSIGGLALAAVVANTTSGLVHSRGTAQSRAAADAGLAAVISDARRTGDVCDVHASGTAPKYSVTSTCTADKVTFESVGTGADGRTTTLQAVYDYTTSPAMSGEAELVFFNSGSDSVYFTNHVMAQTNGDLATILFPGGGLFECKTVVPGNIITKGSIAGQSGCTINGSVYAGGLNPYSGYSLYLNNSDLIQGGAAVVGNVLVAGSPGIKGSLTVPSTAKVTAGWGNDLKKPATDTTHIQGGIVWSSTLGQPSLDPWFDYPATATLLTADWPGYQIVTLTSTSSPYNCSNWTGKSNTFWTSYVTGLSKNTVVDARACPGGMDTAQGANSTATLGVNLVFIANHYTLGTLKLSPKPGTDPQAWFIVPDTTIDASPTCLSSKKGTPDYKIVTDASISVTVNSMMYTPCDITVGNGGTWTGAMYSGSLNDGGDITIYTSKMALPHQWGTGPGGSGSGATMQVLGSRLSQRDVP
ncbi:hypothetical protein [Microbacterium sp.]|uniref:hypothetical protein n=1 Tax=Microbacterium sp. TaxID=51671 RepID=UPI003A8DC2D2